MVVGSSIYLCICVRKDCMWWHTLSYSLPAYSRALIVSVSSMCACVCVSVSVKIKHTVRKCYVVHSPMSYT